MNVARNFTRRKKFKINVMKLRIEMALAHAKDMGRNVTKKQLSAAIWPESNEATQQVNMSKLCNGKTATIKPEWIPVICSVTGVDANFLFGL